MSKKILVKYNCQWKKMNEYTLPADAQLGDELEICDLINSTTEIKIPCSFTVLSLQGDRSYRIKGSFSILPQSAVIMQFTGTQWVIVGYIGRGISIDEKSPNIQTTMYKIRWIDKFIEKIKNLLRFRKKKKEMRNLLKRIHAIAKASKYSKNIKELQGDLRKIWIRIEESKLIK